MDLANLHPRVFAVLFYMAAGQTRGPRLTTENEQNPRHGEISGFEPCLQL